MWGAIVGTIAIVLVTIAVGIWIDWKKPILPRPDDLAKPEPERKPPPPSYAAGEAPATAIPVSPSQLATLRDSQRCPACGAPMTNLPDSDDQVRYDERDLSVLHYACPKCPAKRSLYVEAITT